MDEMLCLPEMHTFNNEYAIEVDKWGVSVEYPWDAPDADHGQWDD